MMRTFLILLMVSLSGIITADTIVHREKSLYRNILVFEYEGQRCMNFTYDPIRFQEQSCFLLENPDYPVHFYSQAIMTGICYHPSPFRVLIIGLGGGVIARNLSTLLPNAVIDSVEIDPAVTRIAEEYFLYRPDGKTQRSHNADGRIFIKRALLKNEKWDWIILDAFNSDYIPEHLMTEEFLTEVKAALNPGGLITANTFSDSALFHSENATYHKVFGDVHQLTHPTESNRILFYRLGGWKNNDSGAALRQQCQSAFERLQLDISPILKTEQALPAWPEGTRILTDQYAPVNLLKD
ncbi:MAG TPA: fused MFS/spermidine synthase [Pseudomonadales bacterium]